MDALVEIVEFHRPVYIFRKNYLSRRRFSANVSLPALSMLIQSDWREERGIPPNDAVS
jgi:hypothetical protein